MKMKKGYVVAATLLIAGGSYYLYSRSGQGTVQMQYKTGTAEKGTLTTSVSASGNVSVDQIANVDPTISGTVADLAVNVGDNVEKGQFLFSIVNDQLGVSAAKATASLEQAGNSVASAKLSIKQAKADYDAAKKKDDADDDAYTGKQLEVLKKKIDIAEDGVVAAEKSYNATLADYNSQIEDAAKRRVTAPISGTVNAVNIKNGDDLSKLSSGSSSRQIPIIIGDLKTLRAEVQVNEVDVPNINIGQKAMLKFDAIDNLQISGKVEKMDALGTISSGVVTYNVIITMDTIDVRIRPEMSVSASIITDVKQDVVIIPSAAVKSENGAYYVQILNASTPERKTVTAGASNNTETEIISGVNVGDKVVTQTIDSSTATSSPASSSSSQGGGIRIPGLSGGGGQR